MRVWAALVALFAVVALLDAQTTQFVGTFNIGTLFGDGNALEVRNATAGQAVRIYGTITDPANYERFTISADTGSVTLATERAGTGTVRDIVFRDLSAPRFTLGGAAPAYYVTLPGTARATLPAAPNGSLLFCLDCLNNALCGAGGPGAVAKRINGSWRCN